VGLACHGGTGLELTKGRSTELILERSVDERVEMFEYEVIPVQVTRGAAGRVADEEWAALRSELNERGRKGFRVVAVSDGAEGRAIIMERPLKEALAAEELTAVSVAEAAEEITRESVVGEPHTD
jgi:hypothetical protein